MIPVTHVLLMTAILFGFSLLGIVLNRHNVIFLLVCVELMLLSVNTNFILFAHQHGEIAGQIFVFFILTVAAAEAAIGLAIVVLLYRHRGNIEVTQMNQLKG